MLKQKLETSSQDEGLRIHVYLAQAGVASRREAEAWIRRGYVQVNGKPAKLGQKIHPGEDEIRVRGKPVSFAKSQEQSVVLAVHKPRGVVTTASDPEGRATVMDLVPKNPRLFPVGRLDLNSEGLLLMTNDGEIAYRMTHPKFEVPKVYDVKIRGDLDQKKLAFLKKGVVTEEGKWKGVEVLQIRDVTHEGVKKFQVRMRIYEGKNRHIRKLFEAVRCRVIRLKRIEMGPITLKGIPRGEYRILSPQMLRRLRGELKLQ